MTISSTFFTLLLFKNPELLQPLPRQSCLIQFPFTLTILPVFIENLQEILRQKLRGIELLAFEVSHQVWHALFSLKVLLGLGRGDACLAQGGKVFGLTTVFNFDQGVGVYSSKLGIDYPCH
jgi:hypothetical protein